jgi:hypothetical protein
LPLTGREKKDPKKKKTQKSRRALKVQKLKNQENRLLLFHAAFSSTC